ncbi:hypothetical protein [Vannielia sp.]|uniref:hypothetical protein n=1 Tax=Vannielia sp. TaxID=2813045 RepID=UPI0026371F36|nr:hypothetical protein [Vannielia sp.]MDF1871479.1 hypothetical protein [Vannielia sp.]
MRPILPAIALLATLAACDAGGDGTNPLTAGPDDEEDSGADPGTSVTSGTTTKRLTGELTGITLNGDGTLTVDNLPFDGPEGTGAELYRPMGLAVVTGFTAYESGDATAETNQVKYFAVYAEGNHSSAGAVGTGDYVDYGFGGAQYGRDAAVAPDIAREGEAVYNGNYGAVRVVTGSNGPGDLSLVSGDIELQVDFLDFETTGAVEGFVTNRTVYDTNGSMLGTLPTIILGTAEINDEGFIDGGQAVTLHNSGPNAGEVFESGGWEGAFAGPNSEEIVGVIVISGPASQAVDEDESAQETGVFIATDP